MKTSVKELSGNAVEFEIGSELKYYLYLTRTYLFCGVIPTEFFRWSQTVNCIFARNYIRDEKTVELFVLQKDKFIELN